MPVENVIKIGLEVAPINGIVKLISGKLAVLKDISDTDSTLFKIGYATYNGEEVFTLEGSIKGEGNISQYATFIDLRLTSLNSFCISYPYIISSIYN